MPFKHFQRLVHFQDQFYRLNSAASVTCVVIKYKSQSGSGMQMNAIQHQFGAFWVLSKLNFHKILDFYGKSTDALG